MNDHQPPPDHDAAYHERYEAEHGGQSCPECRPWEVLDATNQGGIMTNEEALDLLDTFVQEAQQAVVNAVWARAFLIEGGEPAWDAMKSVAYSGQTLTYTGARIATLADDDVFQAILP